MTNGSIQPKAAVPAPNMMPKPASQYSGVPMQKSIRFFIRMLPVFLALVKPASHMAKPACMKKTSAAPSSTQMVFTAENVIGINLLCLIGKPKPSGPEGERVTAARRAGDHSKTKAQGRPRDRSRRHTLAPFGIVDILCRWVPFVKKTYC